MKPLDFNTLDNLLGSDVWQNLSAQAKESIKSMQVPVPQIPIPGHVVLPVFRQQEEKQYVLALGQEKRGPYTKAQIMDFIKAGVLTEEFYLWTQGWSEWKKIKDIWTTVQTS